jgi:hypothetical protein
MTPAISAAASSMVTDQDCHTEPPAAAGCCGQLRGLGNPTRRGSGG